MPAPVPKPTRATRGRKPPANSKPPRDQPTVVTKTRAVRRRGRARNGVNSDEEIQREQRSDSDSDDSSSVHSSSDSDTEPASEVVVSTRNPRVLTPGASQSPHDAPDKVDASSFFASPSNWSEMVADETANGPADLPVIDFSDFGHSVSTTRPAARKQKKAVKKPQAPAAEASSLPSPPLSPKATAVEPKIIEETPAATHDSSGPRRPFGQTARQTYQQRLTDPSYIPTVGEFWGHDDRLMDKDLRSLSSWWRGKWNGRGRGGFDRGFARGRGGFSGGHRGEPRENDAVSQVQDPNLPAVERAWTHDGFEEMKKNEERRQSIHQPARGGFRVDLVVVVDLVAVVSFLRQIPVPELLSRLQHDGFLHLDPSLRARPGEEPAIRVKLPGRRGQVVRPPLRPRAPTSTPSFNSKLAPTSTGSINGSDYTDKGYNVRLPKRSGKEKAVETVDEEDVFSVRPRLVAPNPIPLPEPSNVRSSAHIPQPPSTVQLPHLPDSNVQQQLEKLSLETQTSDPARLAQTEEAVLRNPSNDQVPPPVANFAPPPQLSSPYGSPYGYPAALPPPGIAMNSLGMPYELATGRPVYLQPPVFNPRPMIPQMAHHGMPFVPGHLRQNSGNFVDPSTGTAVFSFPRQSSAVQIRAPGDPKPVTKLSHQRTSTLSTTAPAFAPSGQQESATHVRYPSLAGDAEATQENQEADSGMMAYQPYQQQYYYPEGYGYPPYMDPGHYGEVHYPAEQVPMGTVYYS
ncbi:hypothetical protein C8J56DRAFT_1137158 [Mycena floridula]|nr:hypothetical protein C8J56DRAFT_1137158 [Mycena floridula]